MKTYHTRGSSMLLVLFVLTLLVMTGATAWRATSFALQSVIMRKEQVKDRYAVEALLLYGIAYAQLHANFLHKAQRRITLTFDAWPPSAPEGYAVYNTAVITLKSNRHAVFVTANLAQNQPHEKNLHGSCTGTFKEEGNGALRIDTCDWRW